MELNGDGHCHGSFGELLQGVLPGNRKFLVNLKSKTCSHAHIHLTPSAYSTTKEAQFAESYRRYSKSYKIVRNILVDIGRHDDCYLDVTSDIPVGKGCSSSTADMVASVGALASALSLALKPEYIGQMLTEIEPNDGLHHPGTSAYHHTTGELIARFDYVPPYHILGFDFGGMVDTVEFNRTPFNWSPTQLNRYAELLEEMLGALRSEDVDEIARIATQSTVLWQDVNPKAHLDEVMRFMHDNAGLGVVNTHSGTYLGILFPPGTNNLNHLMESATKSVPDCEVRLFETVTCADAEAALTPSPAAR